MTSRKLCLAAAAGGMLVALRHVRARRVVEQLTGSPPAVRTDDGVRLHVQVDGPPDAPRTVVFVHGFAARAAMFDPQWSALRGEARLVRYDRRGHGNSGWSGFRSGTIERLGRDLGQVVDACGGSGRVVVVGHSMGGMAVLALARLRPELLGNRIGGVALLSTRATPFVAGARSTGAALHLRSAAASAAAHVVWLAAPLVEAVQPFRRRLGRRLLRRRLFAGVPPGRVVSAAQDMWVRTSAAVLSSYVRSISDYDARGSVGALGAVPVLVLAGTEDSTIPARSARWLARHIGGRVRLVLVAGAGHMVTVTHAAAVTAALRDLLADAGAGTDGRTTA